MSWITHREDCNLCLAVIPRYLIFTAVLKDLWVFCMVALFCSLMMKHHPLTWILIAFFFILQAVLLLPTHLNSVP